MFWVCTTKWFALFKLFCKSTNILSNVANTSKTTTTYIYYYRTQTTVCATYQELHQIRITPRNWIPFTVCLQPSIVPATDRLVVDEDVVVVAPLERLCDTIQHNISQNRATKEWNVHHNHHKLSAMYTQIETMHYHPRNQHLTVFGTGRVVY